MLKRPHVAVSPDKRLFVRDRGFEGIAFWRLESEQSEPVCVAELFTSGVGALGFDVRGRLITVTRDAELWGWDVSAVAEGVSEASLAEPEASPGKVSEDSSEGASDETSEDASDETSSEDGNDAPSEADEVAPRVDPQPTEIWHIRLPLRRIVASAFSSDGSHLVVGDESGVVALIDLSGDEPVIARREAHEQHVVALAFDRDGIRFASSGRDRALKIWGTNLTEPAPSDAVVGDEPDPAVAAADEPIVDPDEAAKEVDPATPDDEVAAEEDGVSEDEVLEFFSMAEEAPSEMAEKVVEEVREEADEVEGDEPDEAEEPDEPDDSAADGGAAEDPAEGLVFPQLYETVHTEGWAIALAWDASGHRLAAGAMDNGLYLFDIGEETKLAAVRYVHLGWVSDVEWAPADELLVTASWDTTVGLFDPSDLGPELAFEVHDDYVVDVTFLPSTDFVVSASYDRTAVVWNWRERRAVARLTGHSDWVDFILPLDDARVVSVCADGTNRVWSTNDWSCTSVLGVSVSAGIEVGAPVDLSEYVDVSGLASRALDKPRMQDSEPVTRYRDMRASSFGAGSGQTAIALLQSALETAPDATDFATSAPSEDVAASFDPALPEVDLPEPKTTQLPELSASIPEEGDDPARAFPREATELSDAPLASDSPADADSSSGATHTDAADATGDDPARAFEARDLAAEAEEAPELDVAEPEIDLPDASPVVETAEPEAPEAATPQPIDSATAPVESSPLGEAELPDIEFQASTDQLDRVEGAPVSEVDPATIPAPVSENDPPTVPFSDNASPSAPSRDPESAASQDSADEPSEEAGPDDDPSTLEMTPAMLGEFDDDEDGVGTMRSVASIDPYDDEVEEDRAPTSDGGPGDSADDLPEIDSNWERLGSDILNIEEASVFDIGPAVDMLKSRDDVETREEDRGLSETTTPGTAPKRKRATESGRPALDDEVFRPRFHEVSDADDDPSEPRSSDTEGIGAGETVGYVAQPPTALGDSVTSPRTTQQLPGAPAPTNDEETAERARRHRSKTAAGQDLSEESTFRFFFDGTSAEDEDIDGEEESGATSRLVPDRHDVPGFGSSPEVFDTSVSEIWEARPDKSEAKMGILKKPRNENREFRSAYAIRTYHQWVYSVAISADGESIASCGGNDLVCVWSKVGDLKHQLRAPSSGFNEVKFTPDGDVVVAAGDDGGIHMWMLPQGEYSRIRHAVLDGHDAVVSAVAFTPDGRFMISGSYDGTARVWDMTDGRCRVVLEDHDGPISDVAIAGRRAFTVGHDGTVRIWDDRKWMAVDVFDGFDRLLGVSSNGVIHAWTAANGDAFLAEDARPRGLLQHRGEARGVCVTESGLIVTAGQDSQIRIYNRGETVPSQSLTAPASLWSLDVADNFIAVGGDDGRIHVYRS